MSKEFLHMRSSKSHEFWLPVTDYPRAFRSFPRRIAGSGYEIVPKDNILTTKPRINPIHSFDNKAKFSGEDNSFKEKRA